MKTNNKKIEDKFYGKRVVKGIFAKAMFNFRDVGDAHQKAIAIKTLKNPSLALLGGPTAEEAEFILRKKFNYTDKQIAELKKYEGSRIGAKAKFAKEYILWALPKGSTDRLDEKVMAEGLYTPAQVDDVKRRASADGWHSFRVVAMMSFDDMTNAFKGKGIKKRSSRTGSKARFAVVGSKGNKTAIVIRNGPDADASWIAYVVQDYKTSNEDVIGNMRHYSTEARAKAAALRGLETSGLRASRQGSKAKFANEEIAKGLSKVLKANGFNAMASEVLSGSTDSETLRKYIRALKSKMSPMSGNDRGMVLLETLEKQLASRAGAKAKFDFKPPANWIFDTMVSYARHYQDLGGYKGDAIYERAIDMAQKILSMPDFQRKGKSAHAVARHIIKNEGALKMNLARIGAKVFK